MKKWKQRRLKDKKGKTLEYNQKNMKANESKWKLNCVNDENEKPMITMRLQTQKQKLIAKYARKLRRMLTFSKEKIW